MFLPISDRYRVIFLHQDEYGPKWGYKKIASALQCDVSTVKYWVQRYGEDTDLSDKPKSGRKRKTTKIEDDKIVHLATSKDRPSTRRISTRLLTMDREVSNATILRRLKEAKLVYQKPLSKPLLKTEHRKKRYLWALNHQNFEWSSCLFTDESTFCLFPKTGKVWQAPGEKLIQRTVKHPPKLQVWGCFSLNGFGKLFFFKVNLNAKLMTKIYEKALLPSVSYLFPDNSNNWFLQEDNDPKHKSKICAEWKASHGIEVLPWPANSPDLNPIENVWGLLKLKISQRRYSSLNALEKEISREWKNLDNSYAENLVLSMKNRVISCISAQGDYTCY
jgi:transposase